MASLQDTFMLSLHHASPTVPCTLSTSNCLKPHIPEPHLMVIAALQSAHHTCINKLLLNLRQTDELEASRLE